LYRSEDDKGENVMRVKRVAITYFNELCLHFPGSTDENCEKFSFSIGVSPVEIQIDIS
jgi:hypothetical protein